MIHPTVYLSQATGIPEPSLRLLTTILLGYPMSMVYHYVHSKTANHLMKEESDKEQAKEKLKRVAQIRNATILLSGFSLSLFFNSWDSVHSLVTIIVSYILCAFYQQKRVYAVAGVWIWNSVYLLVGYYVMSANDYDISWTMTQCILCLRLMGFSLDFMDGQEVQKEINKDQGVYEKSPSSSATKPFSFSDHTPLHTLPSFYEVAAYCYFPTAFLVGPQFSFSLYQQWLLFKYSANDSNEKSSQQRLYVLKCSTLAIVYLLLQQIVGSQFPTQYLLTEEYSSLPITKRMFIFWMSGKFVFTKYLGVWLLTEGATASFRLGYEGISSNGKHNFAGLVNVNPIKYELATSINDIIGGFNINTNYWSKYYVFKRLKWMGSKTYSQVGTLVFLAIWHGFHLGYFVTFLMEFLDLKAESILRKWIKILLPRISSTKLSLFFSWFATTTTLVYAGVGFDLLSLSSAWMAYKQVYFYGHILLVLILLSSFLLPKSQTQKINKSE
ncbi:MBOAT, membrane-bound O-acyltransferase family-domain-containing protein [Cunninghamella echinulata]|nr:MBOAT, membrane-bound O-acyltransferase family-domain-containing protein [Cunninghamella echinulata]